jgi:polysaccharide biosynthesis transport protein
MDILLLIKLLWRKKWFIIAVPILGGLASFLFTSNQVSYYRAEAQISTGFATPDQIQLTSDHFNPYNADLKFNNLQTLMSSGITYNLLSYRLILHDLAEINVPFRGIDSALVIHDPSDERRIEQEFKRKHLAFSPLATSDSLFAEMRKYLEVYGYSFGNLQKALVIGRLDRTDYVRVQFTSENPELAAFAANAYCQEFIRYYEHLRLEETGESANFLKELSDQKKADLDQKKETLKIYKSASSIVDVQQESQQTIILLSELQLKRDDLKGAIHGLELQIQRLTDDIDRVKSNKGVGRGDNQSILNLRTLISQLNEKYISGGSSNKVVLDSLNMLRLQLKSLIDNMEQVGTTINSNQTLSELNAKLNDAQIEYKVATSNLTSTELKIRQLQFSMGGYASKEAQVSAIESEIELASKEYLEAINKYNDASNRLSITNTLKQVVIASPPLNPIPTKRILIVGLAVFASFCLCVFAFVVAEVFNTSIRTPERFTQIVRLPMLGYLNRIDIKSFDLKLYFSKVHSNEQIEVFKSLLRKIRFEIDADNSSIILFSSLRKGQGKTFIIFSMSYALSLIDKKVLIIDTNFRSNMLSNLLKQSGQEHKLIEQSFSQHWLPANAGASYEEQEEQNAKSFSDLIVPTIFKNVHLISNGGGIDSPAEIFSGRNFRNLLQSYSMKFDYIFLEGAALNDYSDTKELVNSVDKVIAIFSTEEGIKGTDRQSINYLKSLGDKYKGSILNKADLRDLKL